MADEKATAPSGADAQLKKVYIIGIVSLALVLVVLGITIFLFLKSNATAQLLSQTAAQVAMNAEAGTGSSDPAAAHGDPATKAADAGGDTAAKAAGDAHKEEGGKSGAGGEGFTYVPITPTFTVNIMSGTRARVMQVQVQLAIHSPELTEKITKNIPLIQNTLVDLFSSKKYEDLITPEGRNALRTESLQATQAALKKSLGEPLVEDLLFTSFIMQ